MKRTLADISQFEQEVFKNRDALAQLLSFGQRLLESRHVGLLYGTNESYMQYLPPDRWDRGVMHKFDGSGFSGWALKWFGRFIVKFKGLSPVMLYQEDSFGEKKEADGIISYVLRKHKDFYRQGIKVLIIEINGEYEEQKSQAYSSVSLVSYNGNQFLKMDRLKVNNAIVKQFKAENFISAYVPDYGAIVFNTVKLELLKKEEGHIYLNSEDLKNRLDLLISAIEMASLAHIGRAKGRQAVNLIRRKEKNLRKTAFELKQKEIELRAQREYLRAVGAVTEAQLNMAAVSIPDGVYAFMDMVGSATIRKNFTPRDYFFILNLCHQIAADNSVAYACRVDNFMGDCVFIQNASPFDVQDGKTVVGLHERLMIMVFALSSILAQIHLLKQGSHSIDPDGVVKQLIKKAGCDVNFRAGLETGPAMIGPLGSQKRKVVTAIGKSVNNASRLESSGIKDHIHTSEAVMDILRHAEISMDTPVIWQKLSHKFSEETNTKLERIDFLDGYQRFFDLDAPIISELSHVSYKEYFSNESYVIKCING